jgi:predicted nuclease of predicted toxin-antitoxin system
MKLLFDQNLSHNLVPQLAGLYPDSQHVRLLGMDTAGDETVWNYARENGFAIVSKDQDFFHRSMLLGHPPKVVWLNIGNCTTADINALLQERQANLLAFDEDETASFLILP